MSENSTEPVSRAVEELHHDRQMGIKVKQVTLQRLGETTEHIEVYSRRTTRYKSLDGEGVNEAAQWAHIATFEPRDATDILFGLAGAYGYELEGR
jgi:hypothetical protein